ncbi:matrixin family metalloprotease [Streptomyces sp. B1866]|uniref:matrixin family metalloprotease n=1 Tax=Streptomyces sp. B1866 TaxID=3075431 RepID=UPI0028921326|nr:matrixin family metalloprotease [Streptomyces sp. B1866]MDT3397484.1 matrixin family metalloprotease [Streptomyces sp. B1866]
MSRTTGSLPLAAACAATVLLAVPTPAHGAPAARPAKCTDDHGRMRDSRGRSSVDGHEIRWEDETRFDDARKYATKVWTSSGLTKVKLKPDAWDTIADLQWRDTNTTSGKWRNIFGKWEPHTGADSIYLNRAYLDNGRNHGNDRDRRKVAAHELGHALGFCHKSANWYFTLMEAEHQYLPNDGKPTSQDRKNYHALWG